jgi:hypothetical protein
MRLSFRRAILLTAAAVWPLAMLLSGTARACTIGVFSPEATAIGRPILWKNRDVDNDNQEAVFRTGSRYSYVTNVYGSEDTASAWAGINEAGFAIMNSNSYNLSGRATGADDGSIMAEALGSCATVDDFKRIMDSTNIVGRTQPSNFGVFDATGRTAIYEASNTFYTVCDAADDSLGFLLRANYSMSGDSIRTRGKNRYERAMQLVLPVRRAGGITPRFLFDVVGRDVGQTFFDPYPLPFCDSLDGLAYGYVPIDSTIGRHTTRSVEVMVGPRPGEPASRGMMWISLGAPADGLPIPLWVSGGPVPELLHGVGSSVICDEALRVRDYVRADPSHPSAVNTFRMQLVMAGFAQAESAIFRAAADSEAAWTDGPSPEQAAGLTDWASERVLAAYFDLWDELNHPEWGINVPKPDPRLRARPSVSRETIRVTLPGSSWHGPVRIFDAMGRQVATLPWQQSGTVVNWTPRDLASGTYFMLFPPESGLKPARITYLR